MKSHQGARRGPKPKSDTSGNLVQAGLRMIHAEGYAATGIQAIADSADLPKGSFYNHFASKEVFAAAVIDAYFDRGQEKLRSILGNAEAAPLARLEAYFDNRIAVLRKAGCVRGCLLGNFSAEVADHSPLIRKHLARQFGAWSRYFETCIAEAQKRGTIGTRFPAALLARFLLNSWEGALLRMRAEKSDAPLLEFKAIVFGQLLAPGRPIDQPA